MQFRVEFGLLILLLAFLVSLFGGMNVTIDLAEHWRLIAIIEANPHRYLDYMLNGFLYLILPPAVGLAFSIIAFIRERNSPTGILKWWLPLAVFGGFFFFWGVYTLRWTYTHYYDARHGLELYGSMDTANLILPVYATASLGGILWIFAGVLFMLSPAFKMTTLLNKEKVVKA